MLNFYKIQNIIINVKVFYSYFWTAVISAVVQLSELLLQKFSNNRKSAARAISGLRKFRWPDVQHILGSYRAAISAALASCISETLTALKSKSRPLYVWGLRPSAFRELEESVGKWLQRRQLVAFFGSQCSISAVDMDGKQFMIGYFYCIRAHQNFWVGQICGCGSWLTLSNKFVAPNHVCLCSRHYIS